jgi:3-oxoacyl-[acyl-carrier protein] reductase
VIVGQLDGKIAIITGGASGLGRAYCIGFAREGARVVVADLQSGSEVVAAIEAAGGQAIAVEVDVADEQSTRRMSDAVVAQFGGIDILVNNAYSFH